MIHIIGIGIEGRRSLGERALKVIKKAALLAGGRRHLEEFPDFRGEKVPVTGRLEELSGAIRGRLGARAGVAVLATGDPSLYGIADFIIREFGKRRVDIIPNVSTVQEAFARIKENSNGVRVLSAHGARDLDAVADEITGADKAAIFTGPETPPSKIAGALLARGADARRAYVCEALGTPEERIRKGDLREVSRMRRVHPLNILILIKDGGGEKKEPSLRTVGIPDALFRSSTGMITKEEVRVITLSKLSPQAGSIVWDIGAGCGSVAIEASRLAPRGMVFAVERNARRAGDIEENKKRFCARNVIVIRGSAPGCMEDKGLQAPDAVFVGGGGEALGAILEFAGKSLKRGGRLVVNAVTMESAHLAFGFLKKGWSREVALVSVSKGRVTGPLTLLSAHNPVFIISGIKP